MTNLSEQKFANLISLKIISIIILIPFVLISCAGRDKPQLVDKIQSGDEKLSCEGLNYKLSLLRDDIKNHQDEIREKEDTNTVYIFISIILPLFVFFFDFSEDEEEELRSMEERGNYLEEKYLVKCLTESSNSQENENIEELKNEEFKEKEKKEVKPWYKDWWFNKE